MKKWAFTALCVLALATVGSTQSVSPEVDCFEMAINDLLKLEKDLGWQLNDNDAMIELNLNYAVCECLYNDNCYPIE